MENNKRMPNLEVKDAKIIWKNFSGADYNGQNPDHKRKFCLVIGDVETAVALYEAGWNVKIRPTDVEARTYMQDHFRVFPDKLNYCMEQGIIADCTLYIEVFLRFDLDYYPCTIDQYVGDPNGRPIRLGEFEVGALDRVHILRCDLTIRPKFWKTANKTGITAWLSDMKVLVENTTPSYADEWGIGDPEE